MNISKLFCTASFTFIFIHVTWYIIPSEPVDPPVSMADVVIRITGYNRKFPPHCPNENLLFFCIHIGIIFSELQTLISCILINYADIFQDSLPTLYNQSFIKHLCYLAFLFPKSFVMAWWSGVDTPLASHMSCMGAIILALLCFSELWDASYYHSSHRQIIIVHPSILIYCNIVYVICFSIMATRH